MQRTVGVAIGIPQPWGAELDAHRAWTGDPAAPMIPAHVTLLGPTVLPTGAMLDHEIDRHLYTVALRCSPFGMHLRGTGTFRPVTEVVFVAVAAGISECELLATAIGEAAELRREIRFPYHPHVTVAQDVPPAALDKVYEDLADFSARFRVDRFTLFCHGSNGRWRVHRDFRLGG